MSDLPETRVLSEAIADALDDRVPSVALFTTFSYDPGFFEREILSVVLGRDSAGSPEVLLMQLEESLRSVESVTVYYDPGALVTTSGTSRLGIQSVPVDWKTGYFHPKLVLLLVEDELIVGVLSANLTRSGWWENVECGEILRVRKGERSSVAPDLRALLSQIKRYALGTHEHHGLETIRAFLKGIDAPSQRSSNRRLHPKLFFGNEGSFTEELCAWVDLRGDVNLEIISPYFSEGDDTHVLDELIEATGATSTRLLLPRDQRGSALCSERFYEAVKVRPGVIWGTLGSRLLSRKGGTGDQALERTVHAKVYHLWTTGENKREVVVVGSVNLTRQAHSELKSGNLEAALFLDITSESEPEPWLITDDKRPKIFAGPVVEADGEISHVPPLVVQYDWKEGVAAYMWTASIKGEEVAISGAEPHLFSLVLDHPSNRGDDWVIMERRHSEKVRDALKSSVFLTAEWDGKRGTLLIQETGESCKPSVITTLTAAEILRLWALLTQEQRDAALASIWERHTVDATLQKLKEKQLVTSDSMFDRFAGIYHAFVRLEESVEEAAANGRWKEVEYRLFGQKYDSLPSLLKRVMDEQTEETGAATDPVNAYVTLLTARQTFARIYERQFDSEGRSRIEKKAKSREWKKFFEERRDDVQSLRKQFRRVGEIRRRFDFGTATERKDFFNWFDKQFLLEAKPVEEEA